MTRYFVIDDEPYFSNVILPQFFKHNRFRSFQRQLNNFSFTKMSKRRLPVDENNKKIANAFKHEFFYEGVEYSELMRICKTIRNVNYNDNESVKECTSMSRAVNPGDECVSPTCGFELDIGIGSNCSRSAFPGNVLSNEDSDEMSNEKPSGLSKFVEVLHTMVCDEEVPCIHWSPCGRYEITIIFYDLL
jgi:hypothetical protein